MSEFIYLLFNNATIAAIVAVILGAAIASNQYRRQKRIDRDNEIKKDIISDLIELQGGVGYVMVVLDRIANTYQQRGGESTDTEFYEAVVKYEVPRLSDSINGTIPYLDAKITDKLNNYFINNKEIKNKHEELKRFLKEWHDPIVKAQINLRQRTKEQPMVSTDKLNEKIKELINLVWREKINDED